MEDALFALLVEGNWVEQGYWMSYKNHLVAEHWVRRALLSEKGPDSTIIKAVAGSREDRVEITKPL
jgi:hypothetical protein